MSIEGRYFHELFGVSRANANLTRIAAKAADKGYAVVPIKPTGSGKLPACTLTDQQRTQADKKAAFAAKETGHRRWQTVRHECGLKHAITVTTKAARVFDRLVKRYPELNLAVEVGGSRMLLVDCDTEQEVQQFRKLRYEREQVPALLDQAPTVTTPGVFKAEDGTWPHKNGAHWWFALPDGVDFADSPVPEVDLGGPVVLVNNRYGLVPPSVRAEGPYELLSPVEVAPAWLVDLVRERVAERQERRLRHQDRARARARQDDDPIDLWSAQLPWSDILAPDGWTQPGRIDGCGCEIWTRPGDDWSHWKSATAHEAGCARFDTDQGHGPLHLWTDHPPEFLVDRKTVSKLTYLALRDHDGDMVEAMDALDLDVISDDAEERDELRALLEGDDIAGPGESTGGDDEGKQEAGDDAGTRTDRKLDREAEKEYLRLRARELAAERIAQEKAEQSAEERTAGVTTAGALWDEITNAADIDPHWALRELVERG